MTVRLIMIGAGGFGREALDVVDAINARAPGTYEVLGVLDDGPSELNLGRLRNRGIAYLGPVDSMSEHDDGVAHALGVGAPYARRILGEKFDAACWLAPTLVHPHAVIGTPGSIGPGTIICAGIQISTNIRIGRHVHVNPNATVGHDVELGDYVSVNPAATISGECAIGVASLIGAAAVVLQGLTVGDRAVVGASSCVVREAQPGETLREFRHYDSSHPW